ncbi:MAG: hypothetical protein NC489_44760 [Ruminococcus flavefaciens]|nr:hypothetical protein [Ruminococcus flavefaciens]
MAKTNKGLFMEITGELRAKNLCPNILDEVASASSEVELKGCGWSVVGELRQEFGQIFLDMYAEDTIDGTIQKVHLGTYWTHRNDRQSFRAFAILNGDFIWETNEFIKHNLADFMPDC